MVSSRAYRRVLRQPGRQPDRGYPQAPEVQPGSGLTPTWNAWLDRRGGSAPHGGRAAGYGSMDAATRLPRGTRSGRWLDGREDAKRPLLQRYSAD